MLVAALTACAGCTGEFGQLAEPTPSGTDQDRVGPSADDPGGKQPSDPGGAEPKPLPFAPGPAVLGRLTRVQYENAVRDLLGEDLPVVELEADTAPYLFTSIGAATTSLSERGVQLYELAALTLSRSVFGSEPRRAALLGCVPQAANDACVSGYLERFASRAFRRPLDEQELAGFVSLVATAGGSDVLRGIELATAAVLMSPSFLYRVEVGEPDPSDGSRQRYTGYEMAQRMSFLLWGTLPDAELTRAAAAGDLVTPAGLEAEARRMLSDEVRLRRSFRQFFSQYLGLAALDHLTRDAEAFPAFTPSLGTSMQREIERLVEHVVFDLDTDIRELFITTETFVNAELATLYGLSAVEGSDLTFVSLPSDGPRAGLLTTGGMLALVSHPDRTSPTRRGQFVRQRLLCGTVPEPPPNIPALEETAVKPDATLRERLAEHRTNPACAGCHSVMDPIGLGFEDFDAIGAHRQEEQGRPVDATGDLDGKTFVGGRELGELLREDERFVGCLVKQLYRHAVGRLDTRGEGASLEAVTKAFKADHYRVKELLVRVVLSDAFRFVAAREP